MSNGNGINYMVRLNYCSVINLNEWKIVHINESTSELNLSVEGRKEEEAVKGLQLQWQAVQLHGKE